MQQFLKFITWRLLLCTAQHVSVFLTPIISWSVVIAVLLVVVGPTDPTTTNSTATTTLQR